MADHATGKIDQAGLAELHDRALRETVSRFEELDSSTSRDTAFAKVAARIEGTRLASAALGV